MAKKERKRIIKDPPIFIEKIAKGWQVVDGKSKVLGHGPDEHAAKAVAFEIAKRFVKWPAEELEKQKMKEAHARQLERELLIK